MDKWRSAPHYWDRCQKWANHDREGLKVCRSHLDTRVVCAFDIAPAYRPHWEQWKER